MLWFKRYDFVLSAMAAILDFWVIMMSLRQTNVRIGILLEDLPEKVSLYVIFGALVQLKVFRTGPNGHFRFGPLAENASFFERDRVAKSF